MKLVVAPSGAPLAHVAGASALRRALRDPKVVSIARSMNLDLQDPATLNDLLNQTRQLIAPSTQVALSGNLIADPEFLPIRSPYVRNAIRTYEVIAGLGR